MVLYSFFVYGVAELEVADCYPPWLDESAPTYQSDPDRPLVLCMSACARLPKPRPYAGSLCSCIFQVDCIAPIPL